jgi:hypothetical protein
VAKSKPNATNLMAAGKALSAWKEVADLTGEKDGQTFKDREKELADLWEALGRSRGKNGEGQFKVTLTHPCYLD